MTGILWNPEISGSPDEPTTIGLITISTGKQLEFRPHNISQVSAGLPSSTPRRKIPQTLSHQFIQPEAFHFCGIGKLTNRYIKRERGYMRLISNPKEIPMRHIQYHMSDHILCQYNVYTYMLYKNTSTSFSVRFTPRW